MRELIISDYDSSCNFHACIIQDNEVKEVFEKASDLKEYGLYNEILDIFDADELNSNNPKLLQFDRTIYCNNGDILIIGTLKRAVGEVRFE